MNNDEYYLSILAGLPIDITENLKLSPLKIKDILKLGGSIYSHLLSILLISKSLLEIEEEVSDFEIFMSFYYRDEEYRKLINKALNLFCNSEVILNPRGYIVLNDFILDENNFIKLRSLLRQQNFLKEDKPEDQPIYPNEASKELARKIKEAKAKIQEFNKDQILRLGDIISIVSAYSENIHIFNVWELTVYQLYDAYLRLLMKANYDARFSMMLAGAEIKDELKHWNSRLLLETK